MLTITLFTATYALPPQPPLSGVSDISRTMLKFAISTAAHSAALARLGVSDAHRQSYAPIIRLRGLP